MTKQNQKGFTVLELILILAVLAGLVSAGWYVTKQNKINESKKTDGSQQTSEQKPSEPRTADETAEWFVYESPNNEYKIKLADGWKLQRYLDGPGIYAASSKGIVHQPGTPAVVERVEGGRGFDAVAFMLNYSDANSADQSPRRGTKQGTFKTAQGVEVSKYYFKQTEDPQGPDVPKDGIEYKYYLEDKKGHVVIITHDVVVGETDRSELVEKVIKTLEL